LPKNFDRTVSAERTSLYRALLTLREAQLSPTTLAMLLRKRRSVYLNSINSETTIMQSVVSSAR